MKKSICSFIAAAITVSTPLFAQTTAPETEKPSTAASVASNVMSAWSLDYLDMRMRDWSSSQGFDASRKIYLEAAAKYQLLDTTYLRFRYKSDPSEENDVTKLESIIHFSKGGLVLQTDFDINGNAKSTGATAVGLDGDSKYTFAKYSFSTGGNTFWGTLYPFNFNSEIGSVFRTGDVNTVYSIEGAPNSINGTSTNGASITARTMPGIEIGGSLGSMLSLYGGVGAVRYYYPRGSFNILSGTGANQWESKSDYGWKGGAEIKIASTGTNVKASFVGHMNTKETGSLLGSAYSLIINQSLGKIFIEAEGSYVKNGSNPYNVTNGWFTDALPYRPVYSDEYGNIQSWAGKSDFAAMLKLGYHFDSVSPFVSWKYLGANYVFSDNYYYHESAEKLRTADGSKSHGGMNIIAAGADLESYGLHFIPLAEYKSAKNKVFYKQSDIRSDESLEKRQNKDIVVSLSIHYGF